ncbi:sensor histidine kinase [Flavobacterium faecale]|uniref:sensor histidine kinase n=1 Tax=Flavobacterium faecale TaxID=1355330 RepID=UPI003AB048C4
MKNKTKTSFSQKLKTTNPRALVITIMVSCSMLTLINFYTIKSLSATRAYINGESHYSKGHNKAARNLITYLFTSNEIYWSKFKKNLRIPQGDESARIALQKNLDIEIAKAGFRVGQNDEDDLDDMIWLFKNFQSVPFFKKAVNEWEKGDQLNRELDRIGEDVYQLKKGKLLDNKSKLEILDHINVLNTKITINQDAFSKSFGDGTRSLKKYLFIINVLFILIIVSTLAFYYNRMIANLVYSKEQLSKQKQKLEYTINDLEKTKESLSREIIQHKKIIGTISHDIRSPLKYIQLISKHLSTNTKKEENATSHKYATSIYKSSSQLYDFTKTLIQYSKIYIEERDYDQKPYSIHHIIENKKTLFEEIAKSNGTKIVNLTNKNLTSSVNIRIISIILHNLIDNAVKYTNKGTIEIGAKLDQQKIIYWVKDTGIGMNQDIIDYYTNLFEKRDPEKLILSTYGIGLHLVLELLIILKGNISFSSKENEGTTVTIELNHI